MPKTREVPMIIEDCALMTAGVEYGSSLLGLEPGCDNSERACRCLTTAHGSSLLGLEPGCDPAKAQDLIEDFLERFRGGRIKDPLDENAAAYLGIYWGMTIVLAYDWNWVAVVHGDWRSFGVADPKRMYLALPVSFFHLLMHDKAGEEMPGPAVRFKAVGEKHLPASKPGAFTVIAS